MSQRWPSSGTSAIANATLPHGVSTVAIVSDPISTPTDDTALLISWYIAVELGADDTTVAYAIFPQPYTGGSWITHGTLGPGNVGATVVASGTIIDYPGAAAEYQYALQINPSGGVADSTVSDACIAVIAL